MISIIPQELFLQRHKQISANLIDYSLSKDFASILEEAYKFGKINILEDKQLLSDLITAILYIVIPREKFKEELIDRLKIQPAYAEIINTIVQQKIFEPLSEELEKYKHLLPKTPSKITELKTSSKIERVQPTKEDVKPKTIEELIYKTKPVEESPKEEPQKPQPIPEVILPEIPEIKIERPVNKTGELKRVSAPSVSPEEQTKIHSKLLEAIKKKESTPKIVEQIKKIIESGPKVSSKEKPPPKTPVKAEEPTASKVIGGENSKKFDAAEEKTDATKKPYIFDVKLKEGEKEKSTKSEEPIVYKKYQPQKPFGEA